LLPTLSLQRLGEVVDYDLYSAWRRDDQLRSAPGAEVERRWAAGMVAPPLVSIVTPVFDPPYPCLVQLIDSVRAQTYPYWELCLGNFGNDASIVELIRRAAAADSRIKPVWDFPNRGISVNSNRTASAATGKYVALLDHDDFLDPSAVFASVELLEAGFDFVYSDEDRVDDEGRHYHPFFKPEFSPEMLLSANYLTHFSVFRRDRFEDVGGWDPKTDGAQDWDLFFKLVSLPRTRVAHVARVLYHWRAVPTSTALQGLVAKPYAARSQVRSIERFLSGWHSGSVVSGWHGVPGRPGRVHQDADGALSVSFEPKAPVHVVRWGYSGFVSSVGFGANELTDDTFDGSIAFVHESVVPDDSVIRALAGWAEQPESGAVAPNLVDDTNHLLGPGFVAAGDVLHRLYGGDSPGAYDINGSSGWNRKFVAVGPELFVVKAALVARHGRGFLRNPSPETALQFHVNLAVDAGLHNVAVGSLRHPAAGPLPVLASPSDLHWPVPDPNVSRRLTEPDLLRWFRCCGTTDSAQLSELPASSVRSMPGAGVEPLQLPSALLRHEEFSLDANATALELSRLRNLGPLTNVRTWAIFIPPFDSVYAGVANILRFGDHLIQRGMSVTFVVAHPTLDRVAELSAQAFPLLERARYLTLADSKLHLRESDVGVATFWQTAFDLVNFPLFRRTAYFVQDDESMFYPAGSESALARLTLGLHHLLFTNTESLIGVGGVEAAEFEVLPTVLNVEKFRAEPRRPRQPPRVLFYGRPNNPRNGFEIGIQTLRLLKRSLGDAVEVVTAGDRWNVHDDWCVDFGKVSYSALPELYSTCSAGLFLMFSRHPGVIGHEMMAAGVPVVVNREQAEYSPSLYRHGENCLVTAPLPSALADNLFLLLRDDSLNDRLSSAGRAWTDTQRFDYATCADRVMAHILRGRGVAA
jgi:O-antigen biosynthesis protein